MLRLATSMMKPHASTGDPYWSSVSLLLKGGGANGTNTFTDLSTIGRTISRNGAPVYSNTQTKWASTSIYLDNASCLLAAASPSGFTFGTGTDFTIEFWYYGITTAAFNDQAWTGSINQLSTGAYCTFDTSAYYLRGGAGSTQLTPNGSMATPVGVWKHYAQTRAGTTYRIYISGVLQNSGTPAAFNIALSSGLRIGAGDNGVGSPASFLNGYMDSFRVTTGVARYTTSSFTPPTAEFPVGP